MTEQLLGEKCTRFLRQLLSQKWNLTSDISVL